MSTFEYYNKWDTFNVDDEEDKIELSMIVYVYIFLNDDLNLHEIN